MVTADYDEAGLIRIVGVQRFKAEALAEFDRAVFAAKRTLEANP
jgi:hypothetical protein